MENFDFASTSSNAQAAHLNYLSKIVNYLIQNIKQKASLKMLKITTKLLWQN